MARLIYDSGLRLMECCIRLRVKNVGLGQDQIFIRDGKEGKDRVNVLSLQIYLPLERQID